MRARHIPLFFAAAAMLCMSIGTAYAEKIKIFTGSSPIFAPLFVADKNGYFAAEGLDVQVRQFSSGADATEGFRSGAADFLVASDVPLIYVLASGGTVMVSQFSANPDMLVVIGPRSMAGAADLKGRKVGLQTKSASEYLLYKYLAQSGLTIGDVERVQLAPFDQVAAVARGDVYAVSGWKPFDLKINQLTKGNQVIKADNGKLDYVLYSGIVAKQEFVRSNGNDVERVVRAIARACAWLKESDLTMRSRLIAQYVKADSQDVQHVIENNTWDMQITPRFLSTMTEIESFLADQKLIYSRVDWANAYNWSFARRAQKSLVP